VHDLARGSALELNGLLEERVESSPLGWRQTRSEQLPLGRDSAPRAGEGEGAHGEP